MSFLRHGEIYPPMRARPLPTAPPTHRLDEFPAGYSLAGCSPAEPASASPADAHSEVQSYRRSSVFHRTATSVLTGCLTPGGRLIACLTKPRRSMMCERSLPITLVRARPYRRNFRFARLAIHRARSSSVIRAAWLFGSSMNVNLSLNWEAASKPRIVVKKSARSFSSCLEPSNWMATPNPTVPLLARGIRVRTHMRQMTIRTVPMRTHSRPLILARSSCAEREISEKAETRSAAIRPVLVGHLSLRSARKSLASWYIA